MCLETQKLLEGRYVILRIYTSTLIVHRIKMEDTKYPNPDPLKVVHLPFIYIWNLQESTYI